MKYIWIILSLLIAGCAVNTHHAKHAELSYGTVELVAELPINPGNVAVSQSGRIFSSVHQFRSPDVKLIEITGKTSYVPWPDSSWHLPGDGPNRFNAVLGIYVDRRDRLWALDNGNGGEKPVQPKLLVFDINSGKLLDRYDFPAATGAPGTLLQDLVVDPERDLAYIADVGLNHKPAIVFVDLKQKTSRRFTGHSALGPEKVDMIVEGRLIAGDDGNAIRIGINPITISKDSKTIYFGAMNGQTWYSLPTRLFMAGADDSSIGAAISKVGPKPVSDGAATDAAGNHYFTDVNSNAITVLKTNGKLKHLAQRDAFIWPDNVRFGNDEWLYVSVNQLNRAPAFNGGVDGAELPFRIYRIWTGK